MIMNDFFGRRNGEKKEDFAVHLELETSTRRYISDHTCEVTPQRTLRQRASNLVEGLSQVIDCDLRMSYYEQDVATCKIYYRQD